MFNFQDADEFLEETDIFVPPDGGYGWFVALGAFISLMWTAGTVSFFYVNTVRMYLFTFQVQFWIKKWLELDM
jgi:hypothetical protein